MPDHYLDIISFDKGKYHLYELKMIDAADLWNAKFFGQIMWYRFLFQTEPLNELIGRFAKRAENSHLVQGNIGEILSDLASLGNGEDAHETYARAKFSSLNLIVCGGDGFELAAKFNPAIWSFWVYFSDILKPLDVEFHVYHAFMNEGQLEFFHIRELTIDNLPTKGSEMAWKRHLGI